MSDLLRYPFLTRYLTNNVEKILVYLVFTDKFSNVSHVEEPDCRRHSEQKSKPNILNYLCNKKSTDYLYKETAIKNNKFVKKN